MKPRIYVIAATADRARNGAELVAQLGGRVSGVYPSGTSTYDGDRAAMQQSDAVAFLAPPTLAYAPLRLGWLLGLAEGHEERFVSLWAGSGEPMHVVVASGWTLAPTDHVAVSAAIDTVKKRQSAR